MSNGPDRLGQLSALKRALIAVDEMQAKLASIEGRQKEPIAVIGMACRFPGDANCPEAFWKLLRDGVDAVKEIPPDRWNIDAYYDPDKDKPGKMYTRRGGFLKDIDQFDAQFFDISPREAVSMDPQQRLLLEVGWEALENAGQAPDKLLHSRTGVFVGVMTDDYSKLYLKANDPSAIGAYFATGNEFSFTAGRLSYFLGLHGPSIAVDTACSSSLVAIHLACQSLRAGECDLSLVGGVNLILSPELNITLSQLKVLSADGRCKTFDVSADGFGRGEGCGVVVLKRLSDARADGDHILAVVRGSAVTHGGPSGGLTVPNGLAQQEMIRQALHNAGVKANQISYVEAHGTGTSLGDPIEVGALGAVIGEDRSQSDPLLIGSVKTNVGHMDSAAGIAGLIKVVLCLQNKEIPPHLHFKQINPHISLDDIGAAIPIKRTPWRSSNGPRIAGISAFGLSGTNAHVVVQEAQASQASQGEADRSQQILTLSAKTPDALTELARRYETFLASKSWASLADTCFTAATARSHFSHRAAVVAESAVQMRERLNALSCGKEAAGILTGKVAYKAQPKVAFLFTGQGSQYTGMGRKLYETQPTFRKTLNQCDELLRPHLDHSLLSVLYPDPGTPSPLDETNYSQPALFSLEYALAELWRSWGIEPSAVMGHSLGEYVAACVAGVFSLEDGLKLVAERGRLMHGLPRNGLMTAVFAAEPQLAKKVSPYKESVSIAAINAPGQTVISGKSDAMQMILRDLHEEGLKTQPLIVSHAFHSPLMDPILDAFEQRAKEVSYSAPQIQIISNITGNPVNGADACEAGYWRQHIRKPVRFLDSMKTLHQQGFELFVEIGPMPTLSGMGKRCLPEVEGWLPSLRKGRDDWQQILESLGTLYVKGLPIDWAGFDRDYPRSRLVLPNYPFQRRRYWVEGFKPNATGIEGFSRGATDHRMLHPLLGQRLRSPLKDLQFETRLNGTSPPFLLDHQVYGTVVMPATAFVEMALAAVDSVFGASEFWLEDVNILEALILPRDEERTVQLILKGDGDEEASFQVLSLTEKDEWKLHVTGHVHLCRSEGTPAQEDPALAAAKDRCREEIDAGAYYEDLRDAGLEYGTCFRGIVRLWRHDGEVLGRIELDETLAADMNEYKLHPALLDAAFQLSMAALPKSDEMSAKDSVYLPIGMKRVVLHRRCPRQLWAHVLVNRSDGRSLKSFTVDVRLFDDQGNLAVEVDSLYLARASRQALQRAVRPKVSDWLYEVVWETRELEIDNEAIGSEKERGAWLIFSDENGVGDALAERLQANGESCVLVFPGDAYEDLNEKGFVQINPTLPAMFQRLLHEKTGKTPSLRGVVYLWGLDARGGEETAQAKICGGLLHLIQSLITAEAAELPGLWVVTRGGQQVGSEPALLSVAQAPVWGLAGTIASEHPELQCVRVDLDPWPETDEGEVLFREICARDVESQVAFRENGRFVARWVRTSTASTPDEKAENRLTTPENHPYQLVVRSPGLLGGLELQPMSRRRPGPGEVEILVKVAGLNFKDVLKALGRYSGSDLWLGGECGGTITAMGEGVEDLQVGDEVVAVAYGTFSTFVIAPAELVVPKPKNMRLAEAVTAPVAFLTAYCALNHLGRISEGKRILIHAAAGGVGMAAVQLAQQAGAEIFATAGSPRKRAYLRSLGVQHVLSSRTLDFADELMALTDGRGVDMVLNSLAGDFIPKSLSVLAPGGRFVEIGRTEIWDESKVARFRPDVSYFVFFLDELVDTQPDLIHEMLQEIMARLKEGKLSPLPSHVFPIQDARRAFRYMAQAKHIGKIVISVEEELMLRSEGVVQEDATYLITGGLGGLGLKVAEWLAAEGAMHLVLVGRSQPTAAARKALYRLEEAGVQVVVAQADVSRKDQIAGVLSHIDERMPRLRGVVHSAGILDDGALLQQNWERFARVLAPKVDGAWNLHLLTEKRLLDFFVLFSSTASILGARGQGNYAAANSFLDALAHRRQAQGLPALSINWGPWAEVGMVSSLDSRNRRRLKEQGMSLIPPEHGMQVLGQLLGKVSPQLGVLPVDWTRFSRFFPEARKSPLLEYLVQRSEATIEAETKKALTLQAVLEAGPLERQKILERHLRDMTARVLQLPAPSIDPEQPLDTLGLDSLMALELKNRIEMDFKVVIEVVQILQGVSILQLTSLLLDKLDRTTPAEDTSPVSSLVKSNGDWIDGEDPEKILAKLEQLSDEQVDMLLKNFSEDDLNYEQ